MWILQWHCWPTAHTTGGEFRSSYRGNRGHRDAATADASRGPMVWIHPPKPDNEEGICAVIMA